MTLHCVILISKVASVTEYRFVHQRITWQCLLYKITKKSQFLFLGGTELHNYIEYICIGYTNLSL